jgi:hypothetical protein
VPSVAASARRASLRVLPSGEYDLLAGDDFDLQRLLNGEDGLGLNWQDGLGLLDAQTLEGVGGLEGPAAGAASGCGM